MDDDTERPQATILFTEAALIDLAGIDNATAVTWGIDQAERYLAYLDGVFRDLADNPDQGSVVDQRDEYRTYMARFTKRRSAHGHRIFYRTTEQGILIVRILHTSMNWPAHL